MISSLITTIARISDAILIYKVINPGNPEFLQILQAGDAPEGFIFIAAAESPNNKSLLLISSEGDGVVKIFQAGSRN